MKLKLFGFCYVQMSLNVLAVTELHGCLFKILPFSTFFLHRIHTWARFFRWREGGQQEKKKRKSTF